MLSGHPINYTTLTDATNYDYHFLLRQLLGTLELIDLPDTEIYGEQVSPMGLPPIFELKLIKFTPTGIDVPIDGECFVLGDELKEFKPQAIWLYLLGGEEVRLVAFPFFDRHCQLPPPNPLEQVCRNF